MPTGTISYLGITGTVHLTTATRTRMSGQPAARATTPKRGHSEGGTAARKSMEGAQAMVVTDVN